MKKTVGSGGVSSDLAHLLAQVDAQASVAERHLWLIALFDWVRGSCDSVPASVARVQLLVVAMESDPKIRQRRQSLVEPDPCQPNGQCQCPGGSRKQKSLFYHKKTPCKTLENRLRTARKYGILDKDIIANSRRKGEGKPHDPHSSGGR